MAIRKNTIGRVPTLAGAWDASYVNPKTGHNGYPQKKRVTHLGSEFESLIEDNTYAPATLNQAGTQITFDTEHWLVISNGTDAYLLQNTVNEKLEEMDDVKDAIEAEQASQRESMATMQNTINAKQLEIGAVQTDPVPTQNSGNHMTSGDIYQTLKDSSKGFVDNVPAPDSDKIAKSGGVLNSIIQNGPAFDLSAYNDGEKYADLAEALTALNSLPSVFKKGGMSIKFVQSSDNNYVQCRLMSDEFTTDTTQWAISDEDIYVENPEWIYVLLDAKNRILAGLKSDCSVEWAVGVPTPVKKYINDAIAEIKNGTEGTSLDGLNKIIAFLSELSTSDTLKDLLDTKIDKEEGKSLIDAEYADGIYYIENPEFVDAKTDSKNRILEGTKPDGTKYIEGNLEVKGRIINPDIQEEIDTAIEEMQEEVEQVLDTAQETLTFLQPIENPEYLEVTIDSGNKIVSGRDNNGVLHENVGIETPSADIKQVNTNKLNLTEKGIYDFNNDIDKVYTTVEEAVAKKVGGIIRVGENVVIGLKTLDSPYSAADIEANYKNTLPAPKFPFVKQASIHRLYDDATTPNMLYICSHSDKHIFYSICPTDLKRAVYEEGYYTKYNANYFYYADKHTPSDIHKVVLPATVDGVSMNHRIKYIHEMSNGECLIEIENGDRIPGWADGRHNNIYKVKKVFSGEAIQESDVTLSIALDFSAEKISSFDNIVEYKAGHIVMAPYWGGRTGKVWITKDYGDTWDLIFCADPDNTHYIKPKAEHYGEQDAYGIYPTSELLNPEGQIDWSTPSNGNVHVHGIAYDRWYDRIWIVTGDGDWNTPHDVTGIWWTDDEGYTWKRIGGINDIKTQLIGIIPMEHCVLFPTDGFGDGFWRWSRNGKDEIIKIENCYNYLGYYDALKVVGQRSIKTKNGFYLCAFAPNQYNESYEDYPGGIVVSPNGFDFEIIYKDEYFQGSDDTVEIGWGCDITDCGDKIILSAAQGGYLELEY